MTAFECGDFTVVILESIKT